MSTKGSQLTAFADTLRFALDPFQVAGCQAVEEGHGVLVAAPTGAGKTIVGEFAVFLALATGRKAFYTTPIKALSNQKYHDLVARHGSANVGLLTGDSSVNGDAPVVVMTTEVLRNMVYAGSRALLGLGFVVMDEVHYLADRFRGAVWEEVIIHLPDSVQVVSLSATVSNAEEFGEWLAQVRGNHQVVVSEVRPVPLWQHMLVGTSMFDLFVDDGRDPRDLHAAQVNPELVSAIESATSHHRSDGWVRGSTRDLPSRGRASTRSASGPRRRSGRSGPGFSRGSRPGGGATRAEVIEQLERQGLLPAITFIFSRSGCDAAVAQLLAADVRLVPDIDGARIRERVQERVDALGSDDLGVIGYWDFVEGLSRGFAAHHAGMLPIFREIVEELFTAGQVRAVFATETLALGINMPARTVMVEKLVKFNGQAHVDITPAEYTQLTGRAGRRGIDVEGHAVVQWSPGVDPHAVGGLASTRTYQLRSSFRPTYNMAVNLVAQVGRVKARELLETSFAQFQADRAVVGLATTVRRNEEALAGYAESMHCDRGDFREYAGLRRSLSEAEKYQSRERSARRRAEAANSLEELHVGDVINLSAGRRAGRAVVVQLARGGKGQTSGPGVVTESKQFKRLTSADVPEPVHALARIQVPKNFNPKSAKSRRDLATTMRIKVPHPRPGPNQNTVGEGRSESLDERDDVVVARLHRELAHHPCHDCPERESHARWAQRWQRLRRETNAVQRAMDGRTGSVANTFERVCAVLTQLGYLTAQGDGAVSDSGERLRRLYTERDLLTAQCLRHGVFSELDPAELAACVSALVHEPRREQSQVAPQLPNPFVAESMTAMTRIWSELDDLERTNGLTTTDPPDAGIAVMVHRWASGRTLDSVLQGQDLAAGDFVRRCKQIVDVLGQIGDAAPDANVRRTARRAADSIMRGVVAADRLD